MSKFLIYNTPMQSKCKLIEERKLGKRDKESYTSIYSFETEKNNIKRTKEILSEEKLIFDRLVFDFDSPHPKIAIRQAKLWYDYFKNQFPNLQNEIWFSGKKGAHLYLY